MAYGSYGGYAFRNGESRLDRSDAVITDRAQTVPGIWPGFAFAAQGVSREEAQKTVWENPHGHVVLGDHVVMGAMCGVHQFCRIGPHAMVGALSAVDADVLYMSPAGVSAGPDTFVHRLIDTAGFENFQTQSGWRSIPLERLAYETPDRYAVGLFDRNRSHVDAWTPFRHPVATRRVAEGPMTPIDGATVVCGGWYLADAVEALVESVR